MTRRRCQHLALVMLGAALTSGCALMGPQDRGVRVKPVETSVPAGTADSRAAEAVAAYKDFLRTSNHALRYPTEAGAYSAASDFTGHSTDPMRGQYEAFVSNLWLSHHAFEGTPPRSTIGVASIQLEADPYPLVVLTDCQTDRQTWKARDVRTGVKNPELKPLFATPYGALVDVVYTQQRWGVQSITADPAGTCAG